MKYTIKHVNKFRENYEMNPRNPKVISTFIPEIEPMIGFDQRNYYERNVGRRRKIWIFR